MTTKEVLQQARELITPEGSWCEGARDNYEGAHCALGAIDVVLEESGSIDYDCAVEALSSAIDTKLAFDRYNNENPCDFDEAENRWEHEGRVAGFNNTMGHECTLALFDRAIEAAS